MSVPGEEMAVEPPASPAGPGARLRAAREAKGVAIATVTETLLVDARVIRALEADDYAVFDAPVYARGFLRKYASYLELPVADIVAAYDVLEGGPPTPTLIPSTAAAPLPRDFSALRLPLLALAALVLVGGSYWWWLGHAGSHSAPATPAPAAVAPVAAATESAVPATAPSTTAAIPAEDAAAPLPEPATVTPDAAHPASSPAADAARPVTPPAPTAVAAPAVATTPATVGAADSRAVAPTAATGIAITGVRGCWVEVYGPSGARVFYDMVRSGDQRTVAGPGPWRVFLGNVDGVQLRVGDQTVVVPAARRSGATARFLLSADGTTK